MTFQQFMIALKKLHAARGVLHLRIRQQPEAKREGTETTTPSSVKENKTD